MNTSAPFVPKVKKTLTRPVVHLEEGKPAYVKITLAMYVGKDMEAKRRGRPSDNPDAKKKEPATLAECVNLETGAEEVLICSTVVKSTLTETYPNDSYVNKCFSITKLAKQSGRDYFKYHILEIEDPTATDEPATDTKKPTPLHASSKR